MKTHFSVRDYNSADRPELRAVVNWKNEEGQRERKFFQTKGEAKSWAAQREIELQNQGSEVLTFSTSLRVMAQECQARLAARGKCLRDATEHYLSYLDMAEASVPLTLAVAEFLAQKLGFTRGYMNQLTLCLRRFSEANPGKLVCDITAADCENFLAKQTLAPRTVNTFQMRLSDLFTWCMRPGRRWCKANPVNGFGFRKVTDAPVGIVTAEQLGKLLSIAEPRMLCYIAIGAFAGLRSAELKRLEWEQVDLVEGYIEVLAKNAKTAMRRTIKIQPALRAWIEPFAQATGHVCPPHADQQIGALARKAGFKKWPQNALRHSFASYHLAMFQDAAALALDMGHTTTKMIFQHYRHVVRQAAAMEFWNVLPPVGMDLAEMARQNTSRSNAVKASVYGEKRFMPGWARKTFGYQKTAREYAELFGIDKTSAEHWMKHGKPLDDAQAMEKLARRQYAYTIRQHAQMYGQTPKQIRRWRVAGWPLDLPDRVRVYLAYLAELDRARERAKHALPVAAPAAASRIIAMPVPWEVRAAGRGA